MGSASAWQPTPSGRHLAGRVNKNTVPEVTLRRALHALGFRFRLHRRLDRACTPDVVLPRHRLAIFVDGCFWHGCPIHGRKTFTGPNASLWEDKLRRTKMRDAAATGRAEALGWWVVRLWECQIREDLEGALSEVTLRCMTTEEPASGMAPDVAGTA